MTGLLYTREITTIGKIYNDNQKYDSIGDSFDFKLSIFYDICRRYKLLPDGYMITFPNILKGLVLSYYYNCNLSTKSFEIACESIRNFFEGPEYYRKNLTKWNTITLQCIINGNPGKSIYESLQILITKLSQE